MSLRRSAMRALVVAAVVAAAGLVGTTPALAIGPVGSTGTQNVLVMLVTFNGQTPSGPDSTTVTQQLTAVHDWFWENSYHLADVQADPTSWLSIDGPSSGTSCRSAANTLMDEAKYQAGSQAGVDLSTYEDFVLYFPDCADGSEPTWATQSGQGVWLNGAFDLASIVSGLGHNMGLPTATSVVCPSSSGFENGCAGQTTGLDPFSPMGGTATSHFSAREKNQLGWLAGKVTDLTAGGSTTLLPVHTSGVHVASVQPGGGAVTYWLEYRQDAAGSFDSGLPTAATDGVLVHRATSGTFASTDLINTRFDGGSTDSWTIRDGENFVTPERYRISVSAAVGGEQVTVAVPQQLYITKNGTGTGTVTSSPSGITCGTTCSGYFAPGSTVTLTETPDAGSTFGGWGGVCLGFSPTCDVTMTGTRGATVTFTSTSPPPSRVEESGVGLDGWSVVSDGTASGGSFRLSSTKNNTATFTSPTTTSLTWLTRKGPHYGNATVTIDGVAKGTFNLAATTEQAFSQTFALTSRTHKIVIKVAGTHASPSDNNGVVVDGFVVNGTTTQESAKQVTFDAWKATAANGASGGLYRSTSKLNATATYTFTGSSVDWVTATGPKFGKAAVRIDSGPETTINLYASAIHLQQLRTFTAGTAGSHTIRVRVLNTKDPASAGTAVPVDAFVPH